MIKINKPLEPPQVLTEEKVKKAFQDVVEQKAFIKRKKRYYKGHFGQYRHAVRETLDRYYHKKCVYCEKELLDNDRTIEHYRPKGPSTGQNGSQLHNGYYWLAFSWDNLLLACQNCNRAKGSRFDIEGERMSYQDDSFLGLHQSCSQYDLVEQPLLFNPERENPTLLLQFTKEGYIQSNDERISHTIQICELNRQELVDKRKRYLERLKRRLNEAAYSYFLSSNTSKKLTLTSQSLAEMLARFQWTIRRFKEETTVQEEFFAWKKYILEQYQELLFWSAEEYPVRSKILNQYLRLAIEKSLK